MACKARNLYFIVLVAVMAMSVSHIDAAVIRENGLVLNITLPSRLNVLGEMYCSPNGNRDISRVSTRPLAGADATVRCLRGDIMLGSAVTNANGVFNITLDGPNAAVFDPASCTVSVDLPVDGCSQLPSTGTLMASMTLVNGIGSTVGGIVSDNGRIIDGFGSSLPVIGITSFGSVIVGVPNYATGLFNVVNGIA